MGNTCFRCYVVNATKFLQIKLKGIKVIITTNRKSRIIQQTVTISYSNITAALAHEKKVQNYGRNELNTHVQYLIQIIQLVFNKQLSKLLYRVPMTIHITNLMLTRSKTSVT
jgi:hypothetical protein